MTKQGIIKIFPTPSSIPLHISTRALLFIPQTADLSAVREVRISYLGQFVFGLAVLDVDPGQAGRGGQAQLPVEVAAAARPQSGKHWRAGQRGRVPEHLRAAGPGQGVRPRRGHHGVAEHKLALQPLARHGGHWAGRGQGGAGVAVLSHPLRELIEVRADDEGELRPPCRGLGAGPGLPSGQRLVPGRGRG